LLPLRSETVAKAIFAVGVGCFTAGVAVAVLRHGLYEIDVIVNCTLVYGLLTVLLGLGYGGAVLIPGQLGQLAGREQSSLVVAGSTLAVAAAFQPARRRVQATVDRRFNRRKYDAAKTVEGFSARPHDEVDLDTLSAEVLAVVDQTMQPTRVSLWLRPSPGASRSLQTFHTSRDNLPGSARPGKILTPGSGSHPGNCHPRAASSLQAGRRWVIERIHAWANQYGKLCCTERRRVVVEFWLLLALALIVVGRLIRRAWTTYRWEVRCF
jgi:hypothetical protein